MSVRRLHTLHIGASPPVLEDFRGRVLEVEALLLVDIRRAVELLRTYKDANIGFVDASLVAVAERLRMDRILTTDRRHFSFIRPRHVTALELLP